MKPKTQNTKSSLINDGLVTMGAIYGYISYTDYVKDRIQSAKSAQGRGITKKLAEELQCHTTFISQVVNKKAGFSVEQAIKFGRFFRLDSAEVDYLIDLVGLERAGDDRTKQFFQKRLERQNKQREDLKDRWSKRNQSLQENELTYYGSWIIQVVHACLQLKSCKNIESISSYLGVSQIEVQRVLEILEKMNLASRTGTVWNTTTHFLHLGKESPIIRHFHLQWRQRVCQDFLKSGPPPGTYYSGVLTFAESAESEIREIILTSLDKIMKTIEPSPSEIACGLNIDFFPLHSVGN